MNQLNAECASVFRRLMRVDTCNPPGNELDLVREIIAVTGREHAAAVLRHGGNRASLLIEIPGTNPAKKLGFAGHLDTVPAGESGRWTHGPFACESENGFFYGRGASDMRGGLTAMILLALHSIREETPPVTLDFFFTADEEDRGTGAAAFREKGYFDGLSGLFICEPTRCAPGVTEKGSVWVDLEATGKCSHASMPDNGVNALELGMDFLFGLKKMVSGLPGNRLLGRNTCTITRASSGIKVNIVPDKAVFQADIRLVPGAGIQNEQLIAKIRAAAEHFNREHPGAAVSAAFRNSRRPVEIDPEHPFIERLRPIYKELGLPFSPVGIPYYTDASSIIPFAGIPFVILGPGDPNECHITDEKIEPSSILTAFCIYKEFVSSLRAESADGSRTEPPL